ncbi:DsrE family protein [Streptomyces sp. ISL-99]|uniref:DsrE family protein n=1 Tax=Streptomyces sp. ISL-99 TaxID=2819193 RepID=UPI001BE9B95D|nr:DsrE family protein [Streptomyces sp. ISL-99]MBT2525623.1 DsrE family protein [Streptomyces sp. ISL-99]
MSKVALIVLADTETHADLGRSYNALVTAKECMEAGDDVRLIFDGAGTKWPGVFADPKHDAHQAYQAVTAVVAGTCKFCAQQFEAEKSARQAEVPMLDEYEGHPSLRSLISKGYQVLTF